MEKYFSNSEIRFETEDKNTVEGYALKYGDQARVGANTSEIFLPGSIEIREDAQALINHDYAKIIGRYKANLEFENRDDGLFYRIKLPATTYGNDLKEMIRAGITTGASLSFTPLKSRWQNQTRVIEKAMLNELSITTRKPGYASSSAELRTQDKALKRKKWNRLIIGV